MALLRNRQVRVLGPTGDVASPIFTVEYPDGTREDTPLKFVEMSESEHKEWSKGNPTLVDHPHVISDKQHQDVLDSQDPQKIKKEQDKPKSTQTVNVPAQTLDVKQ